MNNFQIFYQTTLNANKYWYFKEGPSLIKERIPKPIV